jgi:hypothetical protein
MIGYQAGFNCTTGSANTLYGSQSGYSLTSGSNNSLHGYLCGYNLTTGGNNVAMGNYAGESMKTSVNNTFIGTQAGYVSTGSNVTAVGYNSGNDALFNALTQSDIVILGNNDVTAIYQKVAPTVVSDIRDKTEIEKVYLGLDFVNKLNPISYRFKTSRESNQASGRKHLGFSAQEVLELQGDAEIVDSSDADHLKMTPSDLIAVLVKATQEQSALIADLQFQINQLKKV